MPGFSDPDTAKEILQSFRTFAMVGCSSDRLRASHGVARFLLSEGYQVIPINPNETEVLGHTAYPRLAAVPEEIDIEVVDIFRRSSEVGEHVDEAIERGAKAIWMQLGVIDEAAAQRAADAGLLVVMDRCPAIDHPRLIGAR